MTTAGAFTITPGWYAVPGRNEVRWWTGATWAPIRLVEATPRMSMVVTMQNPVVLYLLGAVFLAVATLQFSLGLAAARQGLGAASLANAIFPVLMAVFLLVIAGNTTALRRLPRPDAPALLVPHLRPMPGDAEGPGAGWRPTAVPQIQRWWTGTRWAEYVLERGVPMPTFDLQRTLGIGIATLRWGTICLAVIAVVAVIAAFFVPTPWTPFPIVIAAIGGFGAVMFGLIWALYAARARKLVIPS